MLKLPNGQLARFCRWCGIDLPDDAVPETVYCKRSHAQNARRRRRRLEQAGLQPCRTPHTRAYLARGEALRSGIFHQQSPYPCPCGVYHLTTKPRGGTSCDDGLVRLAASINDRQSR